ncbi:MAG: hypothetical protein ABEK50_00800 [bacterium]
MPSVRSIKHDTDMSSADANEVEQDITRIIRRARATKKSHMFLKRSIMNLAESLETVDLDELTFESAWNWVQDHSDEAYSCIEPFTGFFYSHGLLPGEVSEHALMAYVIKKGIDSGAFQ